MWKRLALIPFGFLLAVLLLELTLQVAALVAQGHVRAGQPGGAGSGDVRVLCIGDSNTYGLYLDRSESYPAQLERLWNATHPTPTLEVLNLGMPGTNSSWLVRESGRLLETFDPDLVIVMVGANDYWTRPVPLGDASEGGGGWLRHSKILRAVYMAQRTREARSVEVIDRRPAREGITLAPGQLQGHVADGEYTVRYGDEEFAMRFEGVQEGEAGDDAALRRNLRTLVERSREHGAQVVIMSYPSRSFFYEFANQTLRQTARQLGAPLVDLDPLFAPRCPDEVCPDLLFPDGHPTARGYHVVAEAIVEWLSQSKFGSPR